MKGDGKRERERVIIIIIVIYKDTRMHFSCPYIILGSSSLMIGMIFNGWTIYIIILSRNGKSPSSTAGTSGNREKG